MDRRIWIMLAVAVGLVLAAMMYAWYLDAGRIDDMRIMISQDKNQSEEIWTEKEEQTNAYVDVDPTGAVELMEELDGLVVIDVSPHYEEGHLPNAVHYYLADNSLDRAIRSRLDSRRAYLVYCHVDSVSILGARKLAEAGFGRVFRLEGNYRGWVEAGYPVIPDLKKLNRAKTAELADVAGVGGRGTAYVFYDQGAGQFYHLVEADLPNLSAGSYYEGRLVNPEHDRFFFTGKMILTPAGQWRLEFVDERDYPDHTEVVVTLERELDEVPERRILEGGF